MKEIDVRDFAEKVALKKNWKVNPDKGFLSSVLEGLLINYERHQFLLCPCRDSWGDRNKDQDIKCPCIYAQQDIDEFGQCFCGLFVDESTEDFQVSSIPDRRPEELYPD